MPPIHNERSADRLGAGSYEALGSLSSAESMDSASEGNRPPADGQSAQDEEPPVTTKKELWGWYLFEVASSGFSGSVLPIFLPLLLVTVATDQAWANLGRSTPVDCDDTHKVDCLKCDPGTGDKWMTAEGLRDLPHLKVYFGSLGINPVSYTTIALGISVLFQVVTFISAGPLVDYGDRRKSALTINSIVGSVACMLCFAVYKPSLWWLAAVLCVIANVAYGLSYIAYNTYLPLLTDSTPEMRQARHFSEKKQQIVRFKVENYISLMGITAGAVLGAVCVLISFAVAVVPHISTELILRVACLIGGIWWLLVYIPPLLWLERRPGPPLPENSSIFLGWIEVKSLIKQSRQHKYAWRFLIFFFIFADGYTTIMQVGVLFAQQQLCMSTPALAALAVIVNFFAIVGNPLFGYLQRKFTWDNNQTLIFVLLLLSALPVYGIVGYFTPSGSFGLKHAGESFAFSGYYGVCLGALLSYSRTLFIDLIPVGSEGAMFSLWSISSRGSAWVGPFVVAIMVGITGSLRSAFIYTLLVVWIPVVFLWFFIDNKEGLVQSGRLNLDPDLEALVTTPDTENQGGRGEALGGSATLAGNGQVDHQVEKESVPDKSRVDGRDV